MIELFNIEIRKYILMCLAVILPFIIIGQNYSIEDSLLYRLRNTNSNEKKIRVLNKLVGITKDINSVKAREYAKKSYSLKQDFDISSSELLSMIVSAKGFLYLGDYSKADSVLQLALKCCIESDSKREIAIVYNYIGLVKFNQENYLEGIDYYLKGLSYLKDELDPKIEVAIFNNLSNSLMKIGEYKKALEYINMGMETNNIFTNELASANLLFTLGNWNSEIKNYSKACNNFESALDIFKRLENIANIGNCNINIGNCYFYLGRYDEALESFNRALLQSPFLELERIAVVHRFIGNIYRIKKQPKKAMEAFQKSLYGFNQIKNDAEKASIYYNLGLLYKDNSNFIQARELFLKSESILDTMVEPLLELRLYHEISGVYQNLENIDKAFEYGYKHNSIQDSLDQNYREAINYKLNYEEERRKNELLENEIKLNKLQNQKREVKMRSSVGLGIAFFIVTIVVLFYINSRRRLKLELRQKNQEIDKLLKDQEIKTSYAKLEGQDEERKRIAQDLHDRVGSILSTIKLYSDGVSSKLDSIQSQGLENRNKANELLDEAASEVRKIAQNIHSGTLTKFGLKAELEALSELLRENKNMDINITTYGLEDRLPVALEIKIYRIIQELISNILKHAKATKIMIQINQFKDVVNFIVQDNGIGFDLKKVEKKDGMGLKNIRSRVYDLHGTIIIDTGKGSGTTITVDIPKEG